MRITINTIRTILIITFLIITSGILVFLVNQVYLTAFAIGWVGGTGTIFEILWTWNWIILFTLYSGLTTIGLIRRKKTGVIFGFIVIISILLYMIIGVSHDISLDRKIGLIDFGLIVSISVISSLILISISKIKIKYHKLTRLDYSVVIILVLLFIYSFIESKMI
jgi:hypothetical protein